MKTTFTAVVDLDGTYITKNSFHLWIIWLLGIRSNLSLHYKSQIVFVCISRCLKRISHSEMKRRVMVVYQRASLEIKVRQQEGDFIKLIRSLTDPRVKELVEQCKSTNAAVVLATAAPNQYAVPFSTAEGFDDCLATYFTSSTDIFENIRENKLSSVSYWLKGRGPIGRVLLITDHLDDAPLMDMAQVVVWCGPQLSKPDLARWGQKVVHIENKVKIASLPQLRQATNEK